MSNKPDEYQSHKFFSQDILDTMNATSLFVFAPFDVK